MSRVRLLAAAAVVGLAAVLATASPAAAHDELLASSPADGERLAVAPAEVSLSFSADVLTMGAAVIVVDQTGRDWVAEEPAVTDATVTATLDEGMPEAGYELRWRVVSSDGHPISGVIPFTIGDAEPLTRTPTPSSGDGGGADATDEQSQNAQGDQDTLRVVLIGAGGAAAAVAVFGLISFLRRRKPALAQPDGPDTPDGQ